MASNALAYTTGRHRLSRGVVAITEFPKDPCAIAYLRQPAGGAHAAAMEVTLVEPSWKEPLVFRLARVLNLPEGWDSYAAPRIEKNAANLALHLLEAAAPHDTPPPIVIPTADGGVQLEWHSLGIDLELDLGPHQAPQFYFRDRGSAQEQEEELGADLSPLVAALTALARRAQEAGR